MTVHRWHALVAAIAWTVVASGLHLLGDHGRLPLPTSWAAADTWYETVGPVNATMSLIRLVAMTASAWLAAATALQLAAGAAGNTALRRAADGISPPWLRDLGRGMANLSLSAGLVVPAVAPALPAAQIALITTEQDDREPSDQATIAPAEDQPGIAVMRPLPTETDVRDQRAVPPSTTTSTAVPSASSSPLPEPLAPPAERAVEPQTYTVEPGDSCWSVAEQLLTEVLGAQPDDRQTAELWRRLIELNRDRFLTGDPDLLYPNQSLLLPRMS